MWGYKNKYSISAGCRASTARYIEVNRVIIRECVRGLLIFRIRISYDNKTLWFHVCIRVFAGVGGRGGVKTLKGFFFCTTKKRSRCLKKKNPVRSR